MHRIVIVLAVLGLVGCTPNLAFGILLTPGGGWGHARGNDPERMCAGATPGRARHACLAAHGVADSDQTEEDRTYAREDAEARATGARRERERTESATCLTTTIEADMNDQRIAPHLDRALVANGISTVNAQVRACRDSSAATGQVLVEVEVAACGCVVAVAVKSTPDRELGACVAASLEHARFTPTETGGAFRIPYSF